MVGRRIIVQFLLVLLCFTSSKSEVIISELMTSNISTIVSEQYDYNGYIELYNDGNPVDLKGWTVENVKEGATNWKVVLDSSHILPNGYSLLFFGKTETDSRRASQIRPYSAGSVGQKLTPDAGSITLSNGVDKLTIEYPKQYPHIAYCADGYMMPTPAKANDHLTTSISNRVAMPTFSSSRPGLYGDKKVEIALACATEGATIYYTLNGDIPTPTNGKTYNAPFSVEASSAVRARAYKGGMLYSDVLTGSFILPEKYYTACEEKGERLPIVSIVANDADIFGDTLGIYVVGTNGVKSNCYEEPSNYNQDWMRAANFEYILNGKVVDNQEVEIGVYGGCTRTHVAKSLKIKANKRTGKNKMVYDNFFPRRDYKKYKSLALRNGGNGYSYVQPRWRDMYIQSLADGMNIDKQMAQPVGYYLNGVFYGMMILTERTNEDYLYHNYGLDEDEIDLLSIDGGEYVAEAGTREAYDAMIDVAENHYADVDFYNQLGKYMDIDEYIDYQIIEQFVANTDWVANNTKLWRKRKGGTFRWILYDTDFGLSYKSSAVDTCMLELATKTKGSKKMKTLLLHSMRNEDFRWKFLDRYLDMIEHQFTDERIDAKWDSIKTMADRDVCATIKNAGFLKCPGNIDVADEVTEEMRTFAKERKRYVVEQLKQEFGLGDDTALIRIRAVFPDAKTPVFRFLLNKREYVSEGELKLNLQRFSNERIKMEVEPPLGYKLQKWAVNDTTVRTQNGNRHTELSLTKVANADGLKITVFFERDDDFSLPQLFINEICASNASTLDDDGNAPDWVEIYNAEDYEVDLGRMIVENETKGVSTTIPVGTQETIIPAHGYALLWADKNVEAGPLHLNFKLSATVEESVKLKIPYMGDTVTLSEMTYSLHEKDGSFGRVSDGSDASMVFANCDEESERGEKTITPYTANGTLICDETPSGFSDQDSYSNNPINVVGLTLIVKGVVGDRVEARLFHLTLK